MLHSGKRIQILLKNNTAAVEKHVPVYSVEGNKVTVTVGSAEHSMVDAHYIILNGLLLRRQKERRERH